MQTVTIQELEQRAFDGAPVSEKEMAAAITQQQAAERLQALREAGEDARLAEQRKADALEALAELENDVKRFLRTDDRLQKVEAIKTLLDEYEEERKAALEKVFHFQKRLGELTKSYPDLDAEVGYGVFRIGSTYLGNITRGEGTHEKPIREALTAVKDRLAGHFR